MSRTQAVEQPPLPGMEPASMDVASAVARAWGLTAVAAANAVVILAGSPGLRISGGRRSPERNRQVGGAVGSYHLTGRAVDFVGSSDALLDGLTIAKALGAREALIHDAGSGLHLHAAW